MRTTQEWIQELDAQRAAITQEMLAIRCMERGGISEQFLKVPQQGKKEPAHRGPYYVLARWEGKKTVSRRLRSHEEREQAREDIEAHKRFVALCREFEELTRRLCALERGLVNEEVLKKKPKSRWNKTRK